MPAPEAEPLLVLGALHSTPARRYLSDDVRELLGLPGDALTMGLLPLGYPAWGRWAQPRRRPLEEVVHWGRWGSTRRRG